MSERDREMRQVREDILREVQTSQWSKPSRKKWSARRLEAGGNDEADAAVGILVGATRQKT